MAWFRAAVNTGGPVNNESCAGRGNMGAMVVVLGAAAMLAT